MSYASVLQAIYNQATAVAGFSSSNVGTGDFDPLRSGQGSACIIGYDSFEQTVEGMGGAHHIRWRFLLGLYTRASGQQATSVQANMDTIRQGFLDRFNQWPRLGTTGVFDAFIEEGAEAPEDYTIGNISYSYQVLRLGATETFAVTYQE